MRTLRPALAVAVVLVAMVTSACASSTPLTPSADAAPRVQAIGGDVALVQTDDGLAGVRVGATEPGWVVPGAVAAPDGSAVFALGDAEGHARQVVRVDPRTGERTPAGTVPDTPGLRVAAVDPGGASVALTTPVGPSTRVLDFEVGSGTLRRSVTFDGVVEPEAYAKDGLRLFAARIYGDRYHVHVLDLMTGAQYPTSGPDKTRSPEDMYGSVVQAALSPDGRQLATLYRDASTPDHTAFVHLLSLENGLTICIDLHAPFGTGTTAADAIEWRDATIAVGHDPGPGGTPTMATFDTLGWANGEAQAHYHADVRDGSAADVVEPALPDGVADVAGFRRFIAIASAG